MRKVKIKTLREITQRWWPQMRNLRKQNPASQ